MRNTGRTAVSFLATCVATILGLVAIPIVTRGRMKPSNESEGTHLGNPG